MGLPASVQRQVEEAERVQQALSNQPPAPAPEATATTTEPNKEEPAPTPDGEPPVATGTEPEQPATPPKKFEKDDEGTWRQRYFGLQGVFNAQVPLLQQQVRDLASKLADAEARAKTPTPAAEPVPAPKVTEKDVEAFGSDLIDVIDRKAQEVVARVVAGYDQKVAGLEAQLADARAQLGNVTQTQVQSAKNAFFSTLDSQMPGWNEMQETPECQGWLATNVPGTRFSWDEALKDAAANSDAARAVEVFKQFTHAYPQFAPKAATRTSAQNELQRQVAPAKSSAATTNVQPGNKRVYTSAEYGDELNKATRLAMKGKFEEAARIESELNAAMAEGRIRP